MFLKEGRNALEVVTAERQTLTLSITVAKAYHQPITSKDIRRFEKYNSRTFLRITHMSMSTSEQESINVGREAFYAIARPTKLEYVPLLFGFKVILYGGPHPGDLSSRLVFRHIDGFGYALLSANTFHHYSILERDWEHTSYLDNAFAVFDTMRKAHRGTGRIPKTCITKPVLGLGHVRSSLKKGMNELKAIVLNKQTLKIQLTIAELPCQCPSCKRSQESEQSKLNEHQVITRLRLGTNGLYNVDLAAYCNIVAPREVEVVPLSDGYDVILRGGHHPFKHSSSLHFRNLKDHGCGLRSSTFSMDGPQKLLLSHTVYSSDKSGR